MVETKYRIEVDGKPVRLFIDGKTKERGWVHDPIYDTFGTAERAEMRANQHGLEEYKVLNEQRDVGAPIALPIF